MKKRSAMRLPAALVAAALAVNGCANLDDKTTSAGIGAAVGCAAGAALAKLTKNDAGTACIAGAVVGGLIGYQRARSSEIQEAQATADEAVKVSGAKATPVQTQPVQVTDKQTGKTETVRAFKTFSVDIPLSQVDKPEGKAAMQKLNDYARKLAREREEEVEMNIVTAPGKGARATQVDSQVLTEEVGNGVVRRQVLSDPRVPANVQRVTIEARNPNRISV
ncbi:MAG: glycine zipper domain-containing protein [Zoogloea sp.]|nr:glycine zipper domain-containing protein [Zoogloea sp.]